MKVGERVRWYLMATTGFEIHAPHWHGNTVLINGMRTDVTRSCRWEMVTAEIVPDDPGDVAVPLPRRPAPPGRDAGGVPVEPR